ncbi:YdeI/OmpD-associated family protein [Salibacteraceae bacterium]|jgi:hypothetical protein|nr:YdeI/OmpD-associated family protein [Salibacteraceae bacterium]
MFNFEFSSILEKHDSSLGWFYVVFVPEQFIIEFGDEKSPRVKALFNQKHESHISVKCRNEERYIVINKTIRKKLNLQLGDLVDIKLEKEVSEYGMPMPEELDEMLAQEQKARKYFQALTPGKQRTLIYLVSNLKSSDARIRKSLGIVEHLSEYEGELDFKLLNEKFKAVNIRFK